MKKTSLLIKWLFCLIPLILALVMYFVLPRFPKFTEYVFSRGIFRVFAFPLEFAVSLLPFSLTEIIVVLLIPMLITLITIFIIRTVKSRHPLVIVEKGMRFLCFSVSMLLFVFMITDGANFSRISLQSLLNLPNGDYTVENLYIVTADLAEKATISREKLPEDENNVVALSITKKELLKSADDVYKNISKDYSFLKTGVTSAKGVALSHLWSYTGTTGVYCPWTLEASINIDVPVSSLGFTCAHEIAHTMGFAKEHECNFLAFLSCTSSKQADYEYSGYLSAFIYCSNSLYKTDRELWKSAVSKCSQGILRDINARNDYWETFEGEAMDTSQSMNDSFIKANGVESGVFSYNEMVGLMLKYYDSLGFFA